MADLLRADGVDRRRRGKDRRAREEGGELSPEAPSRRYHGREAGDELSALLREHILIAVDVLVAAKANDEPALDEALARWDGNADDLAAFLDAANPDNWPLDEMRAMLGEHLALTTQEAVARLAGDSAADIAAYDAIHEQALGMADMLSTGIIAQFPHRFRPGHD